MSNAFPKVDRRPQAIPEVPMAEVASALCRCFNRVAGVPEQQIQEMFFEDLPPNIQRGWEAVARLLASLFNHDDDTLTPGDIARYEQQFPAGWMPPRMRGR